MFILANGDSSSLVDWVSTGGVTLAVASAMLATRVLLKGLRPAKERSDELGLPPPPPLDTAPQGDEEKAAPTAEERQFLLLKEYHDQGLTQSRVSFWFSLIFASVGFVVIITAFMVADSGQGVTKQGRAFLTLLSGTVIEAVASLFFVQSNRARRLMVEFFDRLRSDRKLLESLKLAEAVDDARLRSNLQVMLALSLAEAKTPPSVLESVFGRSIPHDDDQDRVQQ